MRGRSRRGLLARCDRPDLVESLGLARGVGGRALAPGGSIALEDAIVLAAEPCPAREASGKIAQRVEQAYRFALGRQPTAEEVALGVQFVTGENHSQESLWEQFAQVLLLSNEFVFVD